MKKRIYSALLCLIMVFSIAAIPAQASTQDVLITPRWTNCASISLAMSRSGSTVSWGGSIEGYRDTTKITATYTLYKLDENGTYDKVDSWSYTTTSTNLDKGEDVSGTAGTYKLTLSGTVKTATYSEPISSSYVKSL